jgi:hypothetical protein
MTDTVEETPVSIFDICETDENSEENGKWFNDIFGDGTNVDLKIRSIGSKEAQAAIRKYNNQYRKFVKNGKLPEDIDKKVGILILSDAILMDWRGVVGKDGVPIECTFDTRVELLTRLKRLAGIVQNLSSNLSFWRKEVEEDTSKN